MAIGGIDRVQRVQVPVTTPDTGRTEQRERLDLDQGDGFDSDSTDLSGLAPTSDPQAQARLDALCSALPPDQASRLETSAKALGGALIAAGASAPTSTDVQDASSSTLALWLAGSGSDANAAQGSEFMTLAIGGMESYLSDFASNLQNGINLGNELRTYQTELQDMLSSWPDGKTQSFTWKEVQFDDKGGYTVVEKSGDLTKDQAQQLLDKLGEQGKSLSDTNDLAKYDLQQKYQDYTQAVQTLSGIQQGAYQDAMKMIANLKA